MEIGATAGKTLDFGSPKIEGNVLGTADIKLRGIAFRKHALQRGSRHVTGNISNSTHFLLAYMPGKR